ncbi:hypothetical protein VNO77_25619 [Canavalia gladiata]|uniref:Uncharacterized protein n=1 Tax=Canavalia gladiata TaxID=3824 RepID=A0AAN9L8H0_CANGL
MLPCFPTGFEVHRSVSCLNNSVTHVIKTRLISFSLSMLHTFAKFRSLNIPSQEKAINEHKKKLKGHKDSDQRGGLVPVVLLLVCRSTIQAKYSLILNHSHQCKAHSNPTSLCTLSSLS